MDYDNTQPSLALVIIAGQAQVGPAPTERIHRPTELASRRREPSRSQVARSQPLPARPAAATCTPPANIQTEPCSSCPSVRRVAFSGHARAFPCGSPRDVPNTPAFETGAVRVPPVRYSCTPPTRKALVPGAGIGCARFCHVPDSNSHAACWV